jgi:predicted nucleotide-binding protein
MSENDELIQYLEEYKKILLAWKSGNVSRESRQEARSWINQNTPKVRKLVWRAGCGKTMTVGPPPAVGGMIMRNVDPFSTLFDGPYGLNMIPIACDMIDGAIGVIKSEGLPPLKENNSGSSKNKRSEPSNTKVFLVHGQDNEAKQTVARFLEKIGLEVIILHERASSGMTIIEKFEQNSDVAFAVVLMTPDDVGSIKTDKENLRFRARQNVIFELGYFMAKLGRENVCALLKGDLERPSDYDGIIYIALDPNGGWKILLAKEMKESGIAVDLNLTV